jgi:cytochrome c oxidase assembly protein subunit 15
MDTARRLQLLRRIAAACALLVLAVTSLSAFLRLDKAGLGCQPWPACYGATLRAQQAGTAAPAREEPTAVGHARAAHRLTAVAALLLVVAMLVLCFGRAPWLGRQGALCAALLALTLGLAVLGRYSAELRVPAVAIGNLLGGFAMLALCARLSRAGDDAPAGGRALRAAAMLLLALVLAQAALGALLSASYAGTACGPLADCLRAAGGIDTATLDPWREPRIAAAGGAPEPGALAQLLHRGGAMVVTVGTALLALSAWRSRRRILAGALIACVFAQLALGLSLVGGALPLTHALLHNVLAALLVALLARID